MGHIFISALWLGSMHPFLSNPLKLIPDNCGLSLKSLIHLNIYNRFPKHFLAAFVLKSLLCTQATLLADHTPSLVFSFLSHFSSLKWAHCIWFLFFPLIVQISILIILQAMLFKENRLSEAKDDSLCPMTLKAQSYPSTCLLQIHVNQQYSQQPPQKGQQQSRWKHLVTHLVCGALCSHWKPYWKPLAVSCYTVSHRGKESTGAERAEQALGAALPRAGFSQRQRVGRT